MDWNPGRPPPLPLPHLSLFQEELDLEGTELALEVLCRWTHGACAALSSELACFSSLWVGVHTPQPSLVLSWISERRLHFSSGFSLLCVLMLPVRGNSKHACYFDSVLKLRESIYQTFGFQWEIIVGRLFLSLRGPLVGPCPYHLWPCYWSWLLQIDHAWLHSVCMVRQIVLGQ